MHTHTSTSTNALFFLLLLQTTAGKKIKHQPQPSATRKDVASDCDCCEENEKGLLFQRQPRARAIATSEKCTIARSFPRTEQNLKREDQRGRAGASLPSPHSRAASSTTPSRTKKFYYSKGKRVKCVPEEERRERTREGADRLLVIRNLAKEERSSFFLCYLP
nr:uncharacterized protein LOC103241369 [Chlorocebus sabaeus]